MSASRTPRRLGRRTAALLLVPATALLLVACSGAGAGVDRAPAASGGSSRRSAAPSASASASAPTVAADPDTDLCAFLTREDIDVPMEAYGLAIEGLRSGQRDGSPSCTISTADPAETLTLLLVPVPFAQVEQRYTAGPPAEDDAVLLGPSKWFATRSFAAAYGDRTLIVGSTGRGSTPRSRC
ncbi:hypothetical protein [Amnibacterium setariae]|uniref:DUF3558 domain-containing protein n=1 Tax=Amnibacterium setariae TaxID=2306585 RepID=A0A3A1TV69_9MICO|nr:hypothetical protein [Amnibacterium setariae]RIX27710.1 hypothetical protein D1781_09160 [Amnibacterium setariae]